jgi:hypothetical protein
MPPPAGSVVDVHAPAMNREPLNVPEYTVFEQHAEQHDHDEAGKNARRLKLISLVVDEPAKAASP